MRAVVWLLAVAAPMAWAESGSTRSDWGMYAVGGTTGAGLGLVNYWSPHWTFRADLTGGLSKRRDKYIAGDVVYGDAKLDVRGGGLYADYHPFQGDVRVVGGIGLRAPQLAAKLELAPGAQVDVGGTTYDITGQGQWVAEADFPSVMPYLGVGWGFHPQASSRWSFGLDLGVLLGQLKSSYFAINADGSRFALPDVTREQREFDDAVARWKAWPVLQVSLSYRF